VRHFPSGRKVLALGLFLPLSMAVSIAVIRAAAPLKIVITGDSTVSEYPASKPERGWGHYIAPYFQDSVQVVNLASPGRSTKTFVTSGLWKKTLAEKPDIILIQFGHNDSHSPANPEATNADTDYQANLRGFIDDARAMGATPILITPMQRRTATDGLAPYAQAMKKVAVEKNVPLIDLHASSGKLYAELGDEGSMQLANLPTDRTHFNEKGARAMAELVMKELPNLDARLKEDLR
jgi:lysophospholipase L1-like esterase